MPAMQHGDAGDGFMQCFMLRQYSSTCVKEHIVSIVFRLSSRWMVLAPTAGLVLASGFTLTQLSQPANAQSREAQQPLHVSLDKVTGSHALPNGD
jgi:hypothetical protein